MSTEQRDRWQYLIILAVLLEFLAIAFMPICAIPFHTSRNYNEGWNAYFAEAAMKGSSLYPSFDSMATNNYPPLSFYLVGMFGHLIGDNIVAGRLIAICSLLFLAWNVSELARWLGADRKLAVFTSGIFLLGIATLMPQYIAINDPQFLAFAFVTSGVLVFLKAKDEAPWVPMFLSALLIVVGGFIKHSEISFPLAICTWAFFFERRRLKKFLASALLLGGAACLAVYLYWGHEIVRSVLFSARLKQWALATVVMRRDIPLLLPYIGAAILGALCLRCRRRSSLVLIYVAWSMVNGFWMLMGAGVSLNVMCDAVIALSLGGTLFVLGLAQRAQRSAHHSENGSRTPTVAIIGVALPWMISSIYIYFGTPFLHDASMIFDETRWEQLSSELSHASGPVACETLAVCYWARKPLEIDFFNYGQKIWTGQDYVDAPLGFYSRVQQKYYAYIVVEQDSLKGGRLPKVVTDKMFENYRGLKIVAHKELVLVPRP